MGDDSVLSGVYLPDSWVAGIETDSTSLCFLLEAVLEKDHPRFYWPPKPGEQHAYARIRWCFAGEVRWHDGPHLDHPAIDAVGEKDYGNIDDWSHEGNVDYLRGEWGTVAIHEATQSITYLEQ